VRFKTIVIVLSAFLVKAYGFYGVINSDTTWSDTVYVTGDVVVTENASLTLLPGTVVKLGIDNSCWSEWDTTGGSPPCGGYEEVYPGFVDIIVYGSIHSEGTETDSVRFEPVPFSWPPQDSVVWGGIYINWGAYENSRTSDFSYTVIDGSFLGISVNVGFPAGYWDTVYVENSRIVNITPYKEFCICCCGDSGITAYGIITNSLFDLELVNCKIENVRGYWGQCGDNWHGVAGGDGGDAYGVKLVGSWSCNIRNNRVDGIYGGGGGEYIYNPPAPSGSALNMPNFLTSSGGGHGGDAYGIYIQQMLGQSSFSSNTITNVTGGDGGDDDLGPGAPGGEAIDCYLNSTIVSLLVANNEFDPAYGGLHGNSSESRALSKSLVIDGLFPLIGGSLENFNIILGSDYALVNKSTQNINATYNYWGTDDSLVIDSLIWDCVDDTTVGCIDYVPWVYAQGVSEKKTETADRLRLSSTVVKRNLEINWSCGREEKKGEIKLVDASGRVILSKKVKGYGIMNIDLDKVNLPSGVYFVVLETGEITKSVKFMRIKMRRD